MAQLDRRVVLPLPISVHCNFNPWFLTRRKLDMDPTFVFVIKRQVTPAEGLGRIRIGI
jgi:hypothetical protein